MLATGAAAGFYEATAQILPIFLLAMLIGESRMGATAPKDPVRLATSLILYVLMASLIIAGEIAALVAIGSGETRLIHNLACGAIAAGVAFLMMRFLLVTLAEYKDHFSADAQDRQFRVVLIVTLLILIGTQLTLAFATK